MMAEPGYLDSRQPRDQDGVPVRENPAAEAFFSGRTRDGSSLDLESLRKKINSEEYLYEAIQRIAQVLSGELLKISRGGVYHERQRKRRK
jgi:hypothetical protein